MRNRYMIVILTAAVCFGLAGCGGAGASSADTVTAAEIATVPKTVTEAETETNTETAPQDESSAGETSSADSGVLTSEAETTPGVSDVRELKLTAEPFGRVTVKPGNGSVTVGISQPADGVELYIEKAGEKEYSRCELTEKGDVLTAQIPFAPGDLAEVRLAGNSGGSRLYNSFFLDRSEKTDKGYIYTSADSSVTAYMTNSGETSYTLLADNTVYTNGEYVSVNQATFITADDTRLMTGGEIYSVAAKSGGNDLSSASWFRFDGNTWTKLDTDLSEEHETGNTGLRADLAGAGLYVPMAKQMVP